MHICTFCYTERFPSAENSLNGVDDDGGCGGGGGSGVVWMIDCVSERENVWCVCNRHAFIAQFATILHTKFAHVELLIVATYFSVDIHIHSVDRVLANLTKPKFLFPAFVLLVKQFFFSNCVHSSLMFENSSKCCFENHVLELSIPNGEMGQNVCH